MAEEAGATERKLSQIYIISDSTGETAERVVGAALIQFSRPEIRVKTFARVRTIVEVERILKRAQESSAMVVYTIGDPDQRARIHELAQTYDVETLDPIRPLMGKLAQVLDREPAGKAGALQSMDDDYFRRIEAVEFAVKHDDGQMPQSLMMADIVLVGISRTSKTPLSTYLAQRGFRVANVPIVMGIPLPRELFAIPQHRVYGLTIDLASLVRIRRARLKQLNMPLDSTYGMKEHIIKELKYAWKIFRGNPTWPVVDVSQKAIEETASIIQWIRDKRDSGRTDDAAISKDDPDEFSGLYAH
jgi:regulator of PEP synthase PpsR (kinase-PPPase family)